jgi:hypothetical protein
MTPIPNTTVTAVPTIELPKDYIRCAGSDSLVDGKASCQYYKQTTARAGCDKHLTGNTAVYKVSCPYTCKIRSCSCSSTSGNCQNASCGCWENRNPDNLCPDGSTRKNTTCPCPDSYQVYLYHGDSFKTREECSQYLNDNQLTIAAACNNASCSNQEVKLKVCCSENLVPCEECATQAMTY